MWAVSASIDFRSESKQINFVGVWFAICLFWSRVNYFWRAFSTRAHSMWVVSASIDFRSESKQINFCRYVVRNLSLFWFRVITAGAYFQLLLFDYSRTKCLMCTLTDFALNQNKVILSLGGKHFQSVLIQSICKSCDAHLKLILIQWCFLHNYT